MGKSRVRKIALTVTDNLVPEVITLDKIYLSYTQKTGNKEVGPLLENRPG